jgi:DNA-binding SARP family transcriptional activator
LVEFRVLGPVEVIGDGGIPVKLPYGRARVVMALLCTAPGQVISRDRIIDVAWNETPSRTAVTQLHGYISELRRAFGRRELIETQGDGYALRAARDEVDLMRMRALIRQARDQAGHGQLPGAASAFKEALGLWRGMPFRDLAAPEMGLVANLIEEEYLSALEDYARIELGLGNHTSLIVPLTAAAGLHPWREQLRGSLTRSRSGSGLIEAADFPVLVFVEAARVLVHVGRGGGAGTGHRQAQAAVGVDDVRVIGGPVAGCLAGHWGEESEYRARREAQGRRPAGDPPRAGPVCDLHSRGSLRRPLRVR